jgi:hypothetical protein
MAALRLNLVARTEEAIGGVGNGGFAVAHARASCVRGC